MACSSWSPRCLGREVDEGVGDGGHRDAVARCGGAARCGGGPVMPRELLRREWAGTATWMARFPFGVRCRTRDAAERWLRTAAGPFAEDRGHPAAMLGQLGTPDRVDPRGGAGGDRPFGSAGRIAFRREPEGDQLPPERSDAVLLRERAPSASEWKFALVIAAPKLHSLESPPLASLLRRCRSERSTSAALRRRRRAHAPTRPARSGPNATRDELATGWPTASHIRRTWRFRPSCSTSSRRRRPAGAPPPALSCRPPAPRPSAASAAPPVGPARPHRAHGRSAAPRSAGASAGWPARRRW